MRKGVPIIGAIKAKNSRSGIKTNEIIGEQIANIIKATIGPNNGIITVVLINGKIKGTIRKTETNISNEGSIPIPNQLR